MSGGNGNYRFLLDKKEVIDEINRHLWLESEKAGHDIGFDKAAEDWLDKYAVDWIKHNMPETLKKTRTRRTTVTKTRRANTYIK